MLTVSFLEEAMVILVLKFREETVRMANRRDEMGSWGSRKCSRQGEEHVQRPQGRECRCARNAETKISMACL